MPSFNLSDQQWIPCVMLRDGSYRELSLEETLVRSHEIREIRDASPVVTLSLYRLLLVILHRNFGPRNLDAWKQLQEGGTWDAERLHGYLTDHDWFDLFSSDNPFYQDKTLLREQKSNQKKSDEDAKEEGMVPLTKLAREMVSAGNPTLFSHDADDNPRTFSPAQAARLIVAAQTFALPDGRGYEPSPLAFGVAVMVYGNSLFETLLFNLLVYNAARPISSNLEEDKPQWERQGEIASGDLPDGYLSYMTWPHRRLLLLGHQSSLSVDLTHVLIRSGRGLNKAWRERLLDPMVSYDRTRSAGFLPVRLTEEKALWRDSQSLMHLVQHKYRSEPGMVNLLARAGISRRDMHIFGVVADQSKIELWRHERLRWTPCLGQRKG